MSIIMQAKKFNFNDSKYLPKPIILCNFNKEQLEQAVSLNLLLAQKLILCKESMRGMHVSRILQSILKTLPAGVIVKDFEVLFSPEYKIDVLKIMSDIGKNYDFVVIWPGIYNNGRLVYAQEQYPDYQVFDLNEYSLTCVL